jgi:hypothetical protein
MNLKDVLGKRCAIHCLTEDECNRVLGIFAKNNIRWAAGELATNVNYYYKYGKNTCYSIHGRRISYSSLLDNNSGFYTIVESTDFKEFSILDIRYKK